LDGRKQTPKVHLHLFFVQLPVVLAFVLSWCRAFSVDNTKLKALPPQHQRLATAAAATAQYSPSIATMPPRPDEEKDDDDAPLEVMMDQPAADDDDDSAEEEREHDDDKKNNGAKQQHHMKVASDAPWAERMWEGAFVCMPFPVQ